ncbi:MAG: TetR/AcrR family transcriptional regulator [Rhodospirillales bacterium]
MLWKFRFFFGSMDAYLTSSPVVFAEYTSFQKWLIARLVAILGQMTKGGHMKPVQPPNSPHMVAANTRMLWTGWVRWEMIERRNRAGSEEPDEIIVTRMIRQHFSFQEPYYDRGFARRLYGLIGRPQ